MAYREPPERSRGLHFSFVDFWIVFLVFLCVIGTVIRVGFLRDTAEPEAYEIRFIVSDIAATSEQAFVVGDTFRSTSYGGEMGILLAVESVSPTMACMETPTHEIVRVPYPEDTRIDVIGLLSCMGTMGENGFLLGGNFLLSSGVSYKVQSEHMDVTIKILEIEKKGDG